MEKQFKTKQKKSSRKTFSYYFPREAGATSTLCSGSGGVKKHPARQETKGKQLL